VVRFSRKLGSRGPTGGFTENERKKRDSIPHDCPTNALLVDGRAHPIDKCKVPNVARQAQFLAPVPEISGFESAFGPGRTVRAEAHRHCSPIAIGFVTINDKVRELCWHTHQQSLDLAVLNPKGEHRI
jgi:hypothetical protein